MNYRFLATAAPRGIPFGGTYSQPRDAAMSMIDSSISGIDLACSRMNESASSPTCERLVVVTFSFAFTWTWPSSSAGTTSATYAFKASSWLGFFSGLRSRHKSPALHGSLSLQALLMYAWVTPADSASCACDFCSSFRTRLRVLGNSMIADLANMQKLQATF